MGRFAAPNRIHAAAPRATARTPPIGSATRRNTRGRTTAAGTGAVGIGKGTETAETGAREAVEIPVPRYSIATTISRVAANRSSGRLARQRAIRFWRAAGVSPRIDASGAGSSVMIDERV